ncbi:hypothetical protein CVS27_14755 [Arthrobacter glacialis]|uniref:Uncharacterized protein n=1 Tax=Arthrobacter glacialis TaxID=1664 RepID=A0A2S3ZTT2_ARTGL|nr:hypothetical protein CVS27_14755 [Arthrobacter glacialis]
MFTPLEGFLSPISTRQRSVMLAASIAALGAVALVAGSALAAPAVGSAPTPYVPVTHSVDFAAGAASTWTVPANISSIKVTLWGGNGGTNRGMTKPNGIPDDNGIPGGTGAALALDLSVQPGEVLNLSVGFAGNDASNVAAGSTGTQQAPDGAGGFTALRANPAGDIFSHGGAGGSATLLFTSPSGSGTQSLIAIAGGGGGAGGNIGGSSVSQGGMGGSSTLATANDGDPGPSGDEGCPPVAGGLGGQAATMAGGTGQSVAAALVQVGSPLARWPRIRRGRPNCLTARQPSAGLSPHPLPPSRQPRPLWKQVEPSPSRRQCPCSLRSPPPWPSSPTAAQFLARLP